MRADSTMIGIGDQSRMRRITSTPSKSGSPRSTIARSGLCVPASIEPRRAVRRLDHAVALGARARCAGSAGSRARPRRPGWWRAARVTLPAGTGGGVLERQREAEGGAAARQALGPDAAAVQLDDRAADGEAEADAADRAFVAPRWNFANTRSRSPGGKPGPKSSTETTISPPCALRPRRPISGARRACGLRGVLEQVGEHLLDQAGVDAHQRQVARAGRPSPDAPPGGRAGGAAPSRRSRRASASRARARSRRSRGASSAARW